MNGAKDKTFTTLYNETGTPGTWVDISEIVAISEFKDKLLVYVRGCENPFISFETSGFEFFKRCIDAIRSPKPADFGSEVGDILREDAGIL